MSVMGDRNFKLSEIAAALDVPLARVRTMRARNQTACWDSGREAEDAGRGWREYSIVDAVSLASVIEMVERGLNADEAAKVVLACRKFLMPAQHPRSASRADVWIGVLHLLEAPVPVGGQFCDLLLDIDKAVAGNIKAAPDGEGGGAGLILVNASNHYRRLMEKLA
jgi:hypothetical protein